MNRDCNRDRYMNKLMLHLNHKYGARNAWLMNRRGKNGNELILPVNAFYGIPDELVQKCSPCLVSSRERIEGNVAQFENIFPESDLE